MNRLAELFNINHFIVSQVNPHIIPFISTSHPTSYIHQLLYKALLIGQSEFDLRLSQLIEMGVSPTFLHRIRMVIRQTYVGDITIVPQWQWRDYFGLMEDPDGDVLKEFVKRGNNVALDRIQYTQLGLLQVNARHGSKCLSSRITLASSFVSTNVCTLFAAKLWVLQLHHNRNRNVNISAV